MFMIKVDLTGSLHAGERAMSIATFSDTHRNTLRPCPVSYDGNVLAPVICKGSKSEYGTPETKSFMSHRVERVWTEWPWLRVWKSQITTHRLVSSPS